MSHIQYKAATGHMMYNAAGHIANGCQGCPDTVTVVFSGVSDGACTPCFRVPDLSFQGWQYDGKHKTFPSPDGTYASIANDSCIYREFDIPDNSYQMNLYLTRNLSCGGAATVYTFDDLNIYVRLDNTTLKVISVIASYHMDNAPFMDSAGTGILDAHAFYATNATGWDYGLAIPNEICPGGQNYQHKIHGNGTATVTTP